MIKTLKNKNKLKRKTVTKVNKKFIYRRWTARRAMRFEILSTPAQL